MLLGILPLEEDNACKAIIIVASAAGSYPMCTGMILQQSHRCWYGQLFHGWLHLSAHKICGHLYSIQKPINRILNADRFHNAVLLLL